MNASPELQSSNTTVVICSLNRPQILHQTLNSLHQNQTLKPANIILSITTPSDLSPETQSLFRPQVVINPRRGLTLQRNLALERLETEFTLFLDDDVELAPNFIASMESLFNREKQVVLASAELIDDGVKTEAALDRGFAQQLCSNFTPKSQVLDWPFAYGCNMFGRTLLFQDLLFDESLPLYGWLEDLDFSIRSKRRGRVVRNFSTGMVHLGVTSGRISGLGFGYAQIANPLYLWHKQRCPSLLKVLCWHWCKYFAVNSIYQILALQNQRHDRQGRLTGNILALRDACFGKIHPTRVLDLASPDLIGSLSPEPQNSNPG